MALSRPKDNIDDTMEFSLDKGGIRARNIVIRLAQTPPEIEAAQRLRYRVFYEENQAKADADTKASGLDLDKFDAIADHLIVEDMDIADPAKRVVGTYRLIHSEKATALGQFYSEDEYDLTVLKKNGGNLLELGRSCVHENYRNRAILQLLWQGIAEYVTYYDIKLLFGCASMHGTNIDDLADKLSYLYHHHLAPPALRTKALDSRYVDMNILSADDIDARSVMNSLPPLIKGYLRVGAYIGDGAVIDHDFNTTDVCIILKTGLVTDRYRKHYERTTGATIDTEDSDKDTN